MPTSHEPDKLNILDAALTYINQFNELSENAIAITQAIMGADGLKHYNDNGTAPLLTEQEKKDAINHAKESPFVPDFFNKDTNITGKHTTDSDRITRYFNERDITFNQGINDYEKLAIYSLCYSSSAELNLTTLTNLDNETTQQIKNITDDQTLSPDLKSTKKNAIMNEFLQQSSLSTQMNDFIAPAFVVQLSEEVKSLDNFKEQINKKKTTIQELIKLEDPLVKIVFETVASFHLQAFKDESAEGPTKPNSDKIKTIAKNIEQQAFAYFTNPEYANKTLIERNQYINDLIEASLKDVKDLDPSFITLLRDLQNNLTQPSINFLSQQLSKPFKTEPAILSAITNHSILLQRAMTTDPNNQSWAHVLEIHLEQSIMPLITEKTKREAFIKLYEEVTEQYLLLKATDYKATDTIQLEKQQNMANLFTEITSLRKSALALDKESTDRKNILELASKLEKSALTAVFNNQPKDFKTNNLTLINDTKKTLSKAVKSTFGHLFGNLIHLIKTVSKDLAEKIDKRTNVEKSISRVTTIIHFMDFKEKNNKILNPTPTTENTLDNSKSSKNSPSST